MDNDGGNYARVTDLDNYEELALEYEVGDPFPVLGGTTLDRFIEVFQPAIAPGVDRVNRAGVVVATDDGLSRASGRLLAVATNRDLVVVPPHDIDDELARHGSQSVALVSTPSRLKHFSTWRNASVRGQVGVLVGRRPEALSTLIYRSVVLGPEVLSTCVASHPLERGAATADVTTIDQLRTAVSKRPRLLALRGPGRECSVTLFDGLICGRPGPPTEPLAVTSDWLRVTPCCDGQGCFRRDLDDAGRIKGHDLSCTVALIEGCNSLSFGASAYPTEISVALSILEGTAVAVIGAIGTHIVYPDTPDRLAAIMSDDVTLGSLIEQLVAAPGRDGPSYQRFGLFGDPGLVLPALPQSAGDPEPPRTQPQTSRSATLALPDVVEIGTSVLPRLEALAWIDVPVDLSVSAEIRTHVKKAVRRPELLLRELAVDIERLLILTQSRAVKDLIAAIHSPGWDLTWLLDSFKEIQAQEIFCPCCGLPGEELQMTHLIGESLSVTIRRCDRCGELDWHTGLGPSPLVMSGPIDQMASRSGPVDIYRTLHNRSAKPAKVDVGFAFRQRANLGVPEGQSRSLTLAGGETTDVWFEVALGDRELPIDVHTTSFVALAHGVLYGSMLFLNTS